MKKLRLVINNISQKKEREIFFVKRELQTILNLYAKMVSNGSWKDYSFSLWTNFEIIDYIISFRVFTRLNVFLQIRFE